jgi:2-iminobutanoate/2-iminopropanoate deaminase
MSFPPASRGALERRDLIRLSIAAAVATSVPACARRPSVNQRAIQPTDLAYAQALEISGHQRLLFISGQTPEDASGAASPDYRTQYRQVWANIESRLRAADMTLDNLVKVTIFLSDRRYIEESRGLRKEILGDRSPALTIVIAGIFDPAWLLEIEAIAAA